MSEPEIRAGFDQRERELVRSALRRYMEENRIGTPTLLYRIEKADSRRREIPLSTLQRFITAAHHTQDHHVALCHAFVRELPYYGEGRDIAQLGTALLGFLQGQVEGSAHEALTAQQVSHFAGNYETPTASLTLTTLARQPYLHAREIAAATGLISDELSARRRSREGVMVLIGSRIYVVLRDGLTRQLKLCCLMQRAAASGGAASKVLEGETFQPEFMDGMKSIHERVHFVGAAAEREYA